MLDPALESKYYIKNKGIFIQNCVIKRLLVVLYTKITRPE